MGYLATSYIWLALKRNLAPQIADSPLTYRSRRPPAERGKRLSESWWRLRGCLGGFCVVPEVQQLNCSTLLTLTEGKKSTSAHRCYPSAAAQEWRGLLRREAFWEATVSTRHLIWVKTEDRLWMSEKISHFNTCYHTSVCIQHFKCGMFCESCEMRWFLCDIYPVVEEISPFSWVFFFFFFLGNVTYTTV